MKKDLFETAKYRLIVELEQINVNSDLLTAFVFLLEEKETYTEAVSNKELHNFWQGVAQDITHLEEYSHWNEYVIEDLLDLHANANF